MWHPSHNGERGTHAMPKSTSMISRTRSACLGLGLARVGAWRLHQVPLTTTSQCVNAKGGTHALH